MKNDIQFQSQIHKIYDNQNFSKVTYFSLLYVNKTDKTQA